MTTEQNKSPPAHTALPWLYDEQTAEIYIPDDEHEPCDVIADMEVLKTPSHHANANGEFIVRACNSHYELLAALQRWQQCAENNGWTDADHHDADGTGWITSTNSAIAKARGATMSKHPPCEGCESLKQLAAEIDDDDPDACHVQVCFTCGKSLSIPGRKK
jgi:hypothetical protein